MNYKGNTETGNGQNEPTKGGTNAIKNPDDWTTGNEPMTGAQRSYVDTITGGDFDENMSKAAASKLIEEQKDGSKPASNTAKNPDDWKTGDEPMTGAQRSYLKTLSDEAGEPADENLSKAEASKKIDNLQQKTGRGTD